MANDSYRCMMRWKETREMCTSGSVAMEGYNVRKVPKGDLVMYCCVVFEHAVTG